MRDANYTIEPDEDMFKNGLFDSFALAEVGVFIEETFGVYIPDPELTVANMSTLDKMTARVLRDVQ
jgi:acyl carrier protein